MKELIRKLLRENILSEKLTNVDDDVDMLYDMYFKHDIDKIEMTGIIKPGMFKQTKIDTSILKSSDSVKCHELNPCEIRINPGNNFYSPTNKIIGIGVPITAYDFVMNNADGNIQMSLRYLNDERQKKSMIREFTEARFKGSIHHELAHWIDDTLNNKHIEARVNKSMKLGTTSLGGIPVDATRMEIQGQIHNVKQLYNKHKDEWDEMTFQDLIDLSPSLSNINSKFSGDRKAKWRKELKLRMNREGLLGKNMRN